MLTTKKFITRSVNDISQENGNRREGTYDEGIGTLYIELSKLLGGFETMTTLGMSRSSATRVAQSPKVSYTIKS